jgi:ABC-type multidrug transport system ATPase subunit
MLAAMLRETHARGTTLLMTTHDMARGFEICRRAIILNRGRLVWDGQMGETQLEEFQRTYLASVHAPGTERV